VLIGDGAYACVRFAWGCQHQGVTLLARLRLDAALYGCPEAVPPGRRGRRPKKGKRQLSLKARASQAGAAGWIWTEVRWYGGQPQAALAVDRGQPLVQLRTGPAHPLGAGRRPPRSGPHRGILRATDVSLAAETIVAWFVLRWNVEVTFEESRRHLGVETQRQGSDLAIARTTPVLLGLFSLGQLDGPSALGERHAAASVHRLVCEVGSHLLRCPGLGAAGLASPVAISTPLAPRSSR
jgi:hypothetical protein